MNNVQVFEGNRLETKPPAFLNQEARCKLLGRDSSNERCSIPISDELFSSHLLFLGGIGTGKTNAIFQIVSQLRVSMTERDVMVIFDTKGDFYKEFYQPGDTVISNDSKATGSDGADYWNLFKEIGIGESCEANIVEIAKTLFHERTE